MSESARRHVVIRGHVQGVGFRAWVEDTAREHGLTGWVRNRRDRSVEAMFAGPAAAVAAMVEACRHGPRGSRVDGVDAGAAAPEHLALGAPGRDFSMLPTV